MAPPQHLQLTGAASPYRVKQSHASTKWYPRYSLSQDTRQGHVVRELHLINLLIYQLFSHQYSKNLIPESKKNLPSTLTLD